MVLSGRPDFRSSDAPACAAEITREKLFLRLHQELPYASHVETEKWEERKDGSVRIEQVIYVERDSQKKIALGKNGDAIKAISTASRKELSEILEQPVHLFLFVKVRENWGDDPERFREMGPGISAGIRHIRFLPYSCDRHRNMDVPAGNGTAHNEHSEYLQPFIGNRMHSGGLFQNDWAQPFFR